MGGRRKIAQPMPLQPGTRLGPYEVLSALGAGGMGEVWRARDRRLGRDVALKVLPEAFVADSERLARFEREAKVLASLNHPHIAHIYGLEEADAGAGAVRALVLELVEGPTLADRIARGPIPIDEALPIARQIAEALEAAHDQGIIHRDLKPANIKVKPDGTVKVLDFGLAKALAPQLQAAGAAGEALSHSPTLTLAGAATEAGVILGTAAYMAPEQARGRPVDKRADIWAFGCVLYEMLTGRRPFAGADVAETMARVLEREPDWSALPASTPPGVVRVVRRCLRRDLADRLHDIGDARIEIEEARSATAVEVATTSSSRRRVVRGAFLAATIAAIAAVGGFGVARWADLGRSSRPVWFTILPPHGGRVQLPSLPALSPDGKQIAFFAPDESGTPVLWIRSFDSPIARAIPGVRGTSPFWSPDGESLGFIGGGLMRVDLAGGSPQKIADHAGPRSATWGRSGDILFWSTGGGGGLYRVAATGGAITRETSLSEERRETYHAYPHFLPDGRRFLYLVLSLDDRYTGLYAASLDGGEPTFIAPLQSRAEYADGHLIFGRGSDLLAQRFDPAALKLTGEPLRIGDRVGAAFGSFHDFDFTTAPGGVVAYRSGIWIHRSQLVLFDASGSVVRNLGDPDRWYSMALSPDETRLALELVNADEKERRHLDHGSVGIQDVALDLLRRTHAYVLVPRLVARRRSRSGDELHRAVHGLYGRPSGRPGRTDARRVGRGWWISHGLVSGRSVRGGRSARIDHHDRHLVAADGLRRRTRGLRRDAVPRLRRTRIARRGLPRLHVSRVGSRRECLRRYLPAAEREEAGVELGRGLPTVEQRRREPLLHRARPPNLDEGARVSGGGWRSAVGSGAVVQLPFQAGAPAR
jgi:hypothetical protein